MAICLTVILVYHGDLRLSSVPRRNDEKKTAHATPMEKSNEKENISCITMISISR